MIQPMEAALHPAQVRRVRARSELLSLLRDFDADGTGFAGTQAARLESLADDYLFGVGHDDAEVKDAWAELYGRVSRADRRR